MCGQMDGWRELNSQASLAESGVKIKQQQQ